MEYKCLSSISKTTPKLGMNAENWESEQATTKTRQQILLGRLSCRPSQGDIIFAPVGEPQTLGRIGSHVFYGDESIRGPLQVTESKIRLLQGGERWVGIRGR
jgi:hypothetical protein